MKGCGSKDVKKAICAVFVICTMIGFGIWCAPSVYAQEETTALWETMPDGFGDWEDYVPEDVKGQLPDGLFSANVSEAYAALRELMTFGGLLRVVLQLLGLHLSDGIGLLATLVGLVLLAAVLQSVQKALGGKGAEMFGFCVRLTMFAAIITQGVALLGHVQGYFSELQALLGAMVPVMGTLYALGGNLTQAVVNQEVLTVALAVCQYVGSATVLPICGVCFALSLLDAFRSSVRLDAVSSLIKKWYAAFLGFLMTVLTTVLSAQSVLTSRADSLHMKGVKYAVGNLVPVVGGAVSGTLSTVAAGVGVLRGVCGGCGVLLIALLLLPTLLELLLYRAVFQLVCSAAGMLRCEGEARLLGEMAGLYGYLAAVAAICTVTFVVALAILMSGNAAVS